jgi:YesN/AraC family two-component response regulator
LSGAEALQILRKERVDLVITDSYLPPPDGLDDWPGDNP